MPVLHMQTEAVRGMGQQVEQMSDMLQQQRQQLNYSVQYLGNAWQGPSADIFVSEIELLLQQLAQCADTGAVLNQRIQHEVNEWEQVATCFGESTIIGTINPKSDDIDDTESEFDWFKFADNTVPLSVERMLKLLNGIPYENYKDLGRFINLEILDNAKGGWVGRMDDIGHFIKSPYIQEGVPFGLNVLFDEDLRDGNIGRAIAGELFVTGATKLIPVVGPILFISDTFQFGGTIVAGGLEMFGYSDEAVCIQNNLEYIDLSGYVEDIGEAIYDTVDEWISNPSEFVNDVESVTGFVENAGAGLIDAGEDVVNFVKGWF